MADGWQNETHDPVQVAPGTDIGVPGQWTTLARWTTLDEGPSNVEGEVHGLKPDGKLKWPKDIWTQWVRRAGTPDPDRTKRQCHYPGSYKVIATVTTGLEFVTHEDLPIELQAFQNGTEACEMYATAKVLTPMAYLKAKL